MAWYVVTFTQTGKRMPATEGEEPTETHTRTGTITVEAGSQTEAKQKVADGQYEGVQWDSLPGYDYSGDLTVDVKMGIAPS